MQPLLGLLIIAGAVFAIFRRVDVRLALGLAALALGTVGGNVAAVVRTFLVTFSNEKFVIPICCAMGFAHVLRLTECDKHLVNLLVNPLRRVRPVLIPGAVLVGFTVNIPVISQTSTAVAIGSVLVPLLLAAKISPLTTGAALLLGSSIGGELLNPGAPELRTIVQELQKRQFQLAEGPVETAQILERLFPLLMVQLAVATIVFWFLSLRAEARYVPPAEPEAKDAAGTEHQPGFQVNYLKAAVPLLPLVLLFVTGPPFNAVQVPTGWLVRKTDDPAAFDSRLIGAAMLLGVAAAAATTPRAVPQTARAFFEGAGYAFAQIISLIVIATSFGEGIVQVGLAAPLQQIIGSGGTLLVASAGALPASFAWVSGSGMASTQSLYEFFVPPALGLSVDPARVGAVVSIASAAGRTMSPVAAVTLMCASLTGTNPLELIRRVAGPLLAGLVVVIITATILMLH